MSAPSTTSFDHAHHELSSYLAIKGSPVETIPANWVRPFLSHEDYETIAERITEKFRLCRNQPQYDWVVTYDRRLRSFIAISEIHVQKQKRNGSAFWERAHEGIGA